MAADDTSHDGATRGPLDEKIIGSLRELARRSTGGADGIRHLVATFLAGAEQRACEMRRAAGVGDAAGLAQLAHSLAGSSASLGARELAEVCRQIESEATSHALDGVADQLRRLEGALDTVRSSLEPELLGDQSRSS